MSEESKVVSFSVNERYDRIVVLSNGDVYESKAKGVSGNYYNPWIKWDILEEIKRDNKTK